MLIWWLADDRKLKHPAREIIANPRKQIFASAVVLWEVAIKSALGRIDADVDEIEAAIRETGSNSAGQSAARRAHPSPAQNPSRPF